VGIRRKEGASKGNGGIGRKKHKRAQKYHRERGGFRRKSNQLGCFVWWGRR
jgi:hypothetical protein